MNVNKKEEIYSCHNPYFNRWFSAIKRKMVKKQTKPCHNPYFNRWFSAISGMDDVVIADALVTILILIDGFLQCG